MLFPTGSPEAGKCFQQWNYTACVGTPSHLPWIEQHDDILRFSNNEPRKNLHFGHLGADTRQAPASTERQHSATEWKFLYLFEFDIPACSTRSFLALHSKCCYTGHQLNNPRGFIPRSENKMKFRFCSIWAWNEANFAFSLGWDWSTKKNLGGKEKETR